MGSFSYTCGVSKLTIETGDPIRVLLLTRNEYHTGAGNLCYSSDMWVLRTPPIRAEYNDYGSIDNLDPRDEVIQGLWLQGLSVDLLEQGVGNNTCHDVATSRSMTFEELCEAIQEGRVLVQKEEQDFWTKGPMSIEDRMKYEDKTYHPHQPTKLRIEKLLINLIPGSFLVDEVSSNLFRIRWKYSTSETYGQDATHLTKAQTVLQEIGYACMLVAGSSINDTELLVTASPHQSSEVSQKYVYGPRWEKLDQPISKTLPVNWVMIHEDVWQQLVNAPLRSYDHKTNRYMLRNLEDMKASVIRVCDAVKETAKKGYLRCLNPDSTKPHKVTWQDINIAGRYNHSHTAMELAAELFLSNEGCGRNAFSSHVAMLIADQNILTDEIITVLAETLIVQRHLYTIRHMWYPSYSTGPQYGEWKEHLNYLQGLVKFTKHYIKQKR